MGMKSLLVVNDSPQIRDGLNALLETEIERKHNQYQFATNRIILGPRGHYSGGE